MFYLICEMYRVAEEVN